MPRHGDEGGAPAGAPEPGAEPAFSRPASPERSRSDGMEPEQRQPQAGPEPEPEPQSDDLAVLRGGLQSWRTDSQRNWSRLSAAVVPDDVRQSLAELREPGGLGRAARWLFVIVVYSALGAGLWYGMRELYFGSAEADCQSADWDREHDDVETFVGALPAQARTLLLVALGWEVCRRITGFRRDQPGLAQALLVGGHAAGDGQAAPAGWAAIVGSSDAAAQSELQSTWEQARSARGLTQQQAVSSAAAKLVL